MIATVVKKIEINDEGLKKIMEDQDINDANELEEFLSFAEISELEDICIPDCNVDVEVVIEDE